MEQLKRWYVTVSSVGVVAVVVFMALIGEAAEERWSPQFPREGATKLFENEHVIVWEQVGRPEQPFTHKHIRDTLTFDVEPGKVEVLEPDRPGQGGSFTDRIYSHGTTNVYYTRAGLGPHIELAPDPGAIPISIFVEIKGTEPADCAQWSTACP